MTGSGRSERARRSYEHELLDGGGLMVINFAVEWGGLVHYTTTLSNGEKGKNGRRLRLLTAMVLPLGLITRG